MFLLIELESSDFRPRSARPLLGRRVHGGQLRPAGTPDLRPMTLVLVTAGGVGACGLDSGRRERPAPEDRPTHRQKPEPRPRSEARGTRTTGWPPRRRPDARRLGRVRCSRAGSRWPRPAVDVVLREGHAGINAGAIRARQPLNPAL